MQLKYSKSISKKLIVIELETVNFTPRENKALDQFGEPLVIFERMYTGNFPVQISKKIRTGFKVRIKFDGTENLDGAVAAANTFMEEIEEELAKEMGKIMELALDSEFKAESRFVDIKY